MKLKVVSRIMLMLLLTSMLTLAFNVRVAKASGTIYIRSDGSVEPLTAPISSVDNITYTFTSDIFVDSGFDGIRVDRNNIVVDGAGCTLQGTGHSCGIDLYGASNVTIKNLKIQAFGYGIYLGCSVNNSIFGNTIVDNVIGIGLALDCLSNSIYENNITNSEEHGINLHYSSNNTISGNYMANNGIVGIKMNRSSNNTISKNHIANHRFDGINLVYFSDRNCVYKNSIANNGYCGICVYFDSNENNISANDIRANNESGIILGHCSNNIIHGNNITDNGYSRYSIEGHRLDGYGIWLFYSSGNTIYHNNFVNNCKQVHDEGISKDVWDDGYPSGGNYWSDYNGTDADGDGIGNTPYVIDENNQDNNPLMEQWNPSWSARVPVWTQWWFWRIVIAGIIALAGATYFWKKRKEPTPTVPPLPS